MVNTLSGSVCAYRKETVKPRFIRIDEVMALLDVTQDEAMDIALAAGARYQLAKIILVHKERLMKFMKHSARVPSSNKIVEKKFVRIGEGSMTYSIGHTMATYCKYFLSCVFEAVTIALAIVVCNAFINAGLPAFTGSYADWAQTLIYLCEMTFTIAMTVGSVKGAQTLTSKAFGL